VDGDGIAAGIDLHLAKREDRIVAVIVTCHRAWHRMAHHVARSAEPPTPISLFGWELGDGSEKDRNSPACGSLAGRHSQSTFLFISMPQVLNFVNAPIDFVTR
jgi:hypothetical protein